MLTILCNLSVLWSWQFLLKLLFNLYKITDICRYWMQKLLEIGMHGPNVEIWSSHSREIVLLEGNILRGNLSFRWIFWSFSSKHFWKFVKIHIFSSFRNWAAFVANIHAWSQHGETWCPDLDVYDMTAFSIKFQMTLWPQPSQISHILCLLRVKKCSPYPYKVEMLTLYLVLRFSGQFIWSENKKTKIKIDYKNLELWINTILL